jgi:hypothetical protein
VPRVCNVQGVFQSTKEEIDALVLPLSKSASKLRGLGADDLYVPQKHAPGRYNSNTWRSHVNPMFSGENIHEDFSQLSDAHLP